MIINMRKLFTTEQVREIDKYTIEHEPIRSVDLVERAAEAFVKEFLNEPRRPQKKVIVFAGQGNNGADALAIARLLADAAEHEVEVYLINPPSGRLSADCEINKRRLLATGAVKFTEVAGGNFYPPELSEDDLVIDGLFGTGLNRSLEGGFAAIVKYINASPSEVISIDIPSGLFGEDNSQNISEAIIQADDIKTFAFPKLSLLLADNARYIRKWEVLDISLHPDAIESTVTPYHLVEEKDVQKALLPRNRFAHKGMFGHALLIAGSRGKLGAAVLAAKACLRSGAGLVTVHLPGCGETVLQVAFPEAMLSLDSHTDYFSSAPDPGAYTAIAIGPGIGKNHHTASALKALLQNVGKPLILDADALNILADDPALYGSIPPRSILTPHPKEFDRLAGESAGAWERLHKAQAFAVEHNLIVALKGAYTATCTPDGKIYFNPTGNPGMATAGSGDVLTGVILAFLAKGFSPEEAAIYGVYFHGKAGDEASIYGVDEESLIASDIIKGLKDALRKD